MAVKRSHEKVLTRAQAVVPVAATGPFLPTTDDTEGGAIGVFLVDEDGVPYSAGGGTITVEAEATAVAPTYVEGTSNPLSMDLNGGLRITGTINASSSAEATAAAPTYIEGTDNPLSQNLSGDLRVIAKQSGTYTVSGTVAATQSGTWNIGSITTLPALATGANTIGSIANTGFVSTGNVAHDAADSGNPVKVGGRATSAAPAAVASGDRADFFTDLFGSQRVIITDSAGAVLDYTTPALVAGGTAADAAITYSPLTIGGRAANATPTAMSANGDVVNATFDLYGRMIVRESLRENKARTTTTITSSTSETTIVAAAANTFRDIFRLQITNTSASATTVTIRDATAGSAVFVYTVGAGETMGFSGPVSSAATQAAVNNNWTAQCGTSVASVIVAAEYVNNP